MNKTSSHCRKFALFAVLAVCGSVFGLSANGQTHYSSNVSLGVRAGADMTQIMFNPSVKQNFLPGATAGFTFKYIEENHFGIIAELDFTQRGWKENFENAPFSYSRTLNYLELPVMTHIYFGRRGRFFFNAGPVIGVLLGSKTKADFNFRNIRDVPGFPVSDRENAQLDMQISNKFDYGICAGLGGEFNINRRNALSLEVRFYYGLGNIMPSKRADVFSASNAMTLSLALGYWFRIK